MNKKLLYIVGASLLFVVLAIYTIYDAQDTKKTDKKILLSNFLDNVPSIDKIEIQNSLETITLYKQDGIWFIEELDNFFANEKKIANLFYNFSNLYIIDKKTKNKDKYHHLGLQDVSNTSSKATAFSFYKDNKIFKKIIVGSKNFIGNGIIAIHARENSNPQSWLLRGDIEKSVVKTDHKQKEFKIFEEKEVTKISFIKENKSINKNISNEWMSGTNKINQPELNSFIKNLSILKISNHIKKDNSLKLKDFLSLQLESGELIIKIAKKNDDLFVSIENTTTPKTKQLFNNWYVSIDDISKKKFKDFIKK